MSRNIYLGLSLALLAGCADNPYAKAYQPSSASALRSFVLRGEQPIPSAPELVKGSDPKKDWAGLCSEGYVIIGRSQFRGFALHQADAIAHARAVGADRVLVYKGLASIRHDPVPASPLSKQLSAANGTTTPFGPRPAIVAGWGAEPTGNVPTIVRYETVAFFLVKENKVFGTSCTTGELPVFAGR